MPRSPSNAAATAEGRSLHHPRRLAAEWDDTLPAQHAASVLALLARDIPVEHGACYRHPNPDLWFADGRSLQAQVAKLICGDCHIRVECLALADDHGVWGGMTAAERRKAAARANVTSLVG